MLAVTSAPTIQLPFGSYEIVIADPPWKYNLRNTDKSHRGKVPYPTLTNQDILDLSIPFLCAENTYFFLWTTKDHLELAFRCFSKWGITYKNSFVWYKVSKKRTPHIATGHWGRNCHEFVLFGTIGKPKSLTSLGITFPTVFEALRPKEHSRKPDNIHILAERIANALGNPPKIELFARQEREGWDVWGNEV